ncbi:MAG TPA: hypothetical protein VFI17_07125 [Solirubrobacterales bacterium]|nr:hypothetical protein [Solirubrobacterales bacterium]
MSAGRRNQSNSDLRATTAERLEAIVEAAERAAEGVIDDAEAQARRYLQESREQADRESSVRVEAFADLTDSLLEEAGALRRQAERLQATLEEAKRRLEEGSLTETPGPPEEGQEEQPAQVSRLPHLTPVAAPIAEAPAAAPDGGAGASSSAAGARLLATQMAVSGSSREEIAHRLRSGFDIEDATAILDAIMGPED